MIKKSFFPKTLSFFGIFGEGHDMRDLVEIQTFEIKMTTREDGLIEIIVSAILLCIEGAIFRIPAFDIKLDSAPREPFFEYIGRDQKLIDAVKNNFDELVEKKGGKVF